MRGGCQKNEFDTVLNHTYAEEDEPAVNPEIPESAFRVGTYNLWVTNNGSGAYAWSARQSSLAQSIVDNDFDIFGFQECDATIQAQLPKLVAKIEDKYTWWFDQNSHIGIAYKGDRFQLSETKQVFWLSDTPDVKSTCWDGYNRVGVYVEVTDKIHNQSFGMIVTHGPLKSDEYRSKMATLLTARAELYAGNRLPVVLVGDLNTKPFEPAYTILTKDWTDSYTATPEEYVYGPIGTFNSHNVNTVLNTEERRIDYIFIRDAATSKFQLYSYRNDITTYLGLYPSDHCPVSVQMNITHTN